MSAASPSMSVKTAPAPDILLVRILLLIPVFNWFLKDAMFGEEDAKYWFAANMVMIWGTCIFFFGYPAIIIPALSMVPMAFLWILEVCR